MPITSLTCTSRQARTHRLHWMQASRLTAIATWLRSGAGCFSRAGRRLVCDPHAVGPVPELRVRVVRQRAAVGLVGDQQLEHHLARGLGAVGLATSPSCRRSACGCSSRRARARPRSRPCRRGNCRPGGSRAPARSTDAECRCRCAWRPARWFRLRARATSSPSSVNVMVFARRGLRRHLVGRRPCARRRACRRPWWSPPAAPLSSWP